MKRVLKLTTNVTMELETCLRDPEMCFVETYLLQTCFGADVNTAFVIHHLNFYSEFSKTRGDKPNNDPDSSFNLFPSWPSAVKDNYFYYVRQNWTILFGFHCQK